MSIVPVSVKSAAKRVWQKRAISELKQHISDNIPGDGPPVVTVAGLFTAITGLAQAARMTASGLSELGYDVKRVDLTSAIVPHLQKISGSYDADPGEGPIIIVVNPPEALAALAVLGASALKGRVRIGYWVYELAAAPLQWAEEAKYFHKIWAPSAHAAGALSNAGIAADFIPYPVNTARQAKITVPGSKDFKVISFADTQSSLSRKNPMGSISAFRAAFDGVDNARLIIKLSNADQVRPESLATLRAACADDPRITLNTDVLTRRNVSHLLAGCDVFLSLHRAEGYGLLVIEALLQGLDVMFTQGTSTQVFSEMAGVHLIDAFRTPVESAIYKAGEWYEPDILVAAASLRNIYDEWTVAGRDHDRRDQIRAAAGEALSLDSFARTFGQVLDAAGLVKPSQKDAGCT